MIALHSFRGVALLSVLREGSATLDAVGSRGYRVFLESRMRVIA